MVVGFCSAEHRDVESRAENDLDISLSQALNRLSFPVDRLCLNLKLIALG